MRQHEYSNTLTDITFLLRDIYALKSYVTQNYKHEDNKKEVEKVLMEIHSRLQILNERVSAY